MTKPGEPGPRRAAREKPMGVKGHHSEIWRRFLAAEAAGRAEEAEAALAALFALAPSPAPAVGFADRVLAEITRRSLFARRSVRLGLAASLALAALSAALLAPMALPLLRLLSFGELVHAGTGAIAGLAAHVAAGLSVWETVSEIVGAVGRALVRPASLPFLILQFAVAALALRGLAHVAGFRRSLRHVVQR